MSDELPKEINDAAPTSLGHVIGQSSVKRRSKSHWMRLGRTTASSTPPSWSVRRAWASQPSQQSSPRKWRRSSTKSWASRSRVRRT